MHLAGNTTTLNFSRRGVKTMGIDRSRNFEGISAGEELDNRPRVELMECPLCGESFTPKTPKQQFCNLPCQVEMRKTRGVARRPLVA